MILYFLMKIFTNKSNVRNLTVSGSIYTQVSIILYFKMKIYLNESRAGVPTAFVRKENIKNNHPISLLSMTYKIYIQALITT